MNRALIMVGKEIIEGTVTESYQLLIGCDYLSSQYNESEQNRSQFLEEVSEKFANKIIDGESESVGLFNGLKIDKRTNKPVKIQRLEDSLANYLSNQICVRVSDLLGRAAVIPAAETN